MKLCCEPFKRLLNRAGSKGMGVIAFSDRGERRFILQARPFDGDVMEKYMSGARRDLDTGWPEMTDGHGQLAPIVTVMELRLKACPSCARILQGLIEADTKGFDNLAAAMRKFVVA